MTYYTPSGPLVVRQVKVSPTSRLTLMVNDDAGSGYELSCHLRVTSGSGIVAERPMYFSYHGVDGGHDGVGYTP